MTTNRETFDLGLLDVVRQTIAWLPAGTVGIGRDCLWQHVAAKASRLPGAPQGTNGAYFARETFNRLMDTKPFKKFVYTN
jgi:hypothetical protein